MSRSVAATTLVVAVLVQGCARNLPRASSAPVLLHPFQRVWVAGFVSDDSRGVDVNATTVRLLRTELRQRGFEIVEGTPLELKNEKVFDDRLLASVRRGLSSLGDRDRVDGSEGCAPTSL